MCSRATQQRHLTHPYFKGIQAPPTLHRVPAYISRWHQDVKPRNILVKSKKGRSPYDCEFKLADLGSSHFRKHVSSQGEATDRDTYGTRAYGRLQSNKSSDFTIADGNSGAPECYRADRDTEKIRFLVKQSVDIWSLGCIFSEAAVWVIHTKDGLLEYRRRRQMETAQILGFRDGDCFHDGRRVLATVTQVHGTLADDIRSSDHVTGATVEMVTKEMLIEADHRTPAKYLSHRTKTIVHDAETKLRRPASHAGPGSVSGTFTQSPPRTPPEPPPGHVQPNFSKSHNRGLPSHAYAGSPTSISYDEDEAYHQEPVDHGFFGKGPSQQAHYSDWPIRRHGIGPVTHATYAECEDQDRVPANHLNRAFSDTGPAQDSPSSSSGQGQLGTRRKRRRTPSDVFSSANTGNGPDTYAQNGQETYNFSQHNSFTAPPGRFSRASTATLVQDLHNGSRAGEHHPYTTPGERPHRFVPTGSFSVPPPVETQPRRRPPFLSVNDAQQWKCDKKEHRGGRLPHEHLLADLNMRDHVSQLCICNA